MARYNYISSILGEEVVQKPWREKECRARGNKGQASVAESKVADESGKSADDKLAEQSGELESILVDENSTPLDRPFQPADFEKDQTLTFILTLLQPLQI